MTERQLALDIGEAVAAAIGPALERIESRVARVADRVEAVVPRRHLTDSTKRRHREAIGHLGGLCPCCGQVRVLDDAGAVIGAEYDHAYSRERRGFEETWLICKGCHRALTAGGRVDRLVEFAAYQRAAARYEARLAKPLPLFGD